MVAVLFIACLALTHISVLSKEINHSSKARDILSEKITQSEIELNSEDAGSHISVKHIEANSLLARKMEKKAKFPREVNFVVLVEAFEKSGKFRAPSVITSKKKWKKVLKLIRSESNTDVRSKSNLEKAPRVDFKVNNIVRIKATRVTGGSLIVTTITESKNSVKVSFEVVSLPGARVSENITNLYQFLKIPKIRNKEVKFDKTLVTMTAPTPAPIVKKEIFIPEDPLTMAPSTQKSTKIIDYAPATMAPTVKLEIFIPYDPPMMAPTA